MSTQPTPASQDKTLYVICHGAIATLQTDNNLIVMLPDIGSTHTYKAGNWLVETTIEKGSLNTLENVTGGMAKVPNVLNAPLRPATAARPPFATFILPRPANIYPLFQVNISKDALVPTNGGAAPSADLVVPYVPVFEYTYKTTPRLGNIWPLPSDNLASLPDNYTTLHIFAEDEIPLDDAHAVNAFNLTCQLLGLNIQLAAQIGPNMIKPVPSIGLPPGLEKRCFEFQPLDHRRSSLLAIAGAKENGHPIADPWGALPYNDLSALEKLYFGEPADASVPGSGFSSHLENPACVNVLVGVSGQH